MRCILQWHEMLPHIGKHVSGNKVQPQAVQPQSQCRLQWSATVASTNASISGFSKEHDSKIVHGGVGTKCMEGLTLSLGQQLVRKCMEQYNLLHVSDKMTVRQQASAGGVNACRIAAHACAVLMLCSCCAHARAVLVLCLCCAHAVLMLKLMLMLMITS